MVDKTNEWDTSSGLLDDFDFHIKEAWWGHDLRFGEGKAAILYLRGEAYVDGELEDEEATQMYSAGEQWIIGKGGEEVNHSAGEGKKFSDASNVGKVIEAIKGLGDDVVAVLQERGSPRLAATWIGLQFHMVRQPFSYKNRKTGEESSYEVLLPTEFLGVEEEEEAPAPTKAAAKKAAAPARKAAASTPATPATTTPARRRAKTSDATPAAESELRQAAKELAAQYAVDEHQEFVEDIFDPETFGADRVAALNADEGLQEEVLNPESDFWTETHS